MYSAIPTFPPFRTVRASRAFGRALVPIALALCMPLAFGSVATAQGNGTAAGGFTLAQVKSYPFPNALTAAHAAERLVWAFNERGMRNLWVAEGPSFTARQLTRYDRDDGQELSSVALSPDGEWVVYIRGGDFGSNFDDALPVNPLGMPTANRVLMWAVPFAGGTPVSLGEGNDPVIAPDSRSVVFTRYGQLWRVSINGSAPATQLTGVRGTNGDPHFSPDGSQLAFVSSRGDHAFVGVFTDDSTPIRWMAPSADRDWAPRWSPDGMQLVFARRAGNGGAPAEPFERRPSPWSLQVADVRTGEARELWASDTTMPASVPSTDGGINLHWAASNRIVFVQYADGWPHLYSVPATGGTPLLLTPGDYMAEHIQLSPDRRTLLFSANTGATPGDIDRRHIVRVPVDRAAAEVVTPGTGLEWTPVMLPSGRVAGIGATAQRPPLPMVLNGSTPQWIAENRVPADFPTSQLVTPTPVTFTAADGVQVHAQLFLPPGTTAATTTARLPAIVYVHGGPSRQMLLGWHYGDYYANAYAMNQYLANRGFVVLSVNYRLGIGYGYDFYRPSEGGAEGASEYRDIRAAGEYLRTLTSVDASRIGVYGGSYGGFLTALALGRDSELFAAGVDIHGVHDFTADGGSRFGAGTWRYEVGREAIQRRADVAWGASPVSSVATWRSPVLLIHGDDDRNVRFSQTVDLVQRLRAQRVPFESIIIPDDTHHWMRFANQLRVNGATAEFFERWLKP